MLGHHLTTTPTMTHIQRLLSVLFLALMPCWVYAQDPNPGDDFDLEGVLVECAADETGGTSLILDNSRTKVGRDFYDLFYKHWSALATQADTTKRQKLALIPQADTTKRQSIAPSAISGDVVIMIEEIPSPGTANQILISIDDQPVWQQFVQARYDVLEADALYALDVVRQYLANYQETQQQLGSQDQKGSGVY